MNSKLPTILYQCRLIFFSGNDYKLVMSQWEDFFNTQPDPATANYNLDVLTDFRAYRFKQSIQNNPYFFNGPFTGVAVQPAAFTFIYRFMANKSAEHPEVSPHLGLTNLSIIQYIKAYTRAS